jgi:catechol 2,3-dioxygenase-like lactoylglutathione lyase family enzyme
LSAVVGLVPMAHVADLPRTIEFYARLGFSVEGEWKADGKLVWADLRSGDAALYVSQASDPVVAAQQAVLFYAYTDDVHTLRQRLTAAGVKVGEIERPPYMKAGEIRVEDPDGYVLLIGQIDE